MDKLAAVISTMSRTMIAVLSTEIVCTIVQGIYVMCSNVMNWRSGVMNTLMNLNMDQNMLDYTEF